MTPKRRSRSDVSPDGVEISINYDGSRFIGRFNSTRILKNAGIYHVIQDKENLDNVLFFGDYIGLLVSLFILVSYSNIYSFRKKKQIGIYSSSGKPLGSRLRPTTVVH